MKIIIQRDTDLLMITINHRLDFSEVCLIPEFLSLQWHHAAFVVMN